jgi:hypothetical protein
VPLKTRRTSSMKTWTSILIGAVFVCVLVLTGYGVHTTARVHKLEQRLAQTNERLERVEATLRPHPELIGSNVSPK